MPFTLLPKANGSLLPKTNGFLLPKANYLLFCDQQPPEYTHECIPLERKNVQGLFAAADS